MLKEKKVLIYGKGRVGNALKSFCEYLKIDADIRDDSDAPENFDNYSTIVPSPGISPKNKIYQTGKILGELDFVYNYLPKGFKIISITGTDGKSTTAWLEYNLLKQEYGEEKVFLSGNFEIPFAETVQTILEKGLKNGYIVVEISSFMAYNIKAFTSTHSIFTNFETDHLNWHSDLQDYFDAKMRLLEHTTGTSCINEQVFERAKEFGLRLPKNIPNVRVFGKRINGIKPDSTETGKNDRIGVQIENRNEPYDLYGEGGSGDLSSKSEIISGFLKDRTDGENIIISGRKKYLLSESKFSGMHNAMNILSATLVTNALRVCSKRVRNYLGNISGLSHRLEFVNEKNGIPFIDDSKSTSAQSLIAALGSFGDRKVCLIAGGSDKGDTFEHLGPVLKQKVQHAELFGATREILGKICQQYDVSFHYSENMDEAVSLSAKAARKGDTVLLSPGCASFGLFKDYLDRANKFREAVERL